MIIATKTNFSSWDVMAQSGKEGLVMLGAGGALQDWINGVTGLLVEEGIAPEGYEFNDATYVNTTGGRTDLLLTFNPGLDIGRLAIWRLAFGDCSWLSDYVVNYRTQHGLEELEEDDNEYS